MRRSAILAFTLALSLETLAQAVASQQQTPPPVPITADKLWSAMLVGNQHFASGKIAYDTLKEERLLYKDHQSPPVTVLSCSDSRVPPELVFNQSVGAIFGVRTAGNVADELGIASIEFAILNGYTKLLVVLGHENCGAVRGALAGVDPNTPALSALVKQIRMSFIGIPFDSRDAANLKRAVEMNTRASAAQLVASSVVIRNAVLTEKVKVITAYYDFATGEVKVLP